MHRLWIAGAAALAITAPAARAAAPPSATDPAASAEARAALDYLRGLGTVSGRFEQTDARGAVVTGSLFLQRPGRARFDYDPPARLAIIADGHKVFQINGRLGTLQGYPLGMTPLGPLLARSPRLESAARVTAVESRAGGFSVTVAPRRDLARGSLTLEFSRSPTALAGWSTSAGPGKSVRVRILELKPASPRDDSFFDAHRRAAELGAR